MVFDFLTNLHEHHIKIVTAEIADKLVILVKTNINKSKMTGKFTCMSATCLRLLKTGTEWCKAKSVFI